MFTSNRENDSSLTDPGEGSRDGDQRIDNAETEEDNLHVREDLRELFEAIFGGKLTGPRKIPRRSDFLDVYLKQQGDTVI